jgi:hypothetical protein
MPGRKRFGSPSAHGSHLIGCSPVRPEIVLGRPLPIFISGLLS